VTQVEVGDAKVSRARQRSCDREPLAWAFVALVTALSAFQYLRYPFPPMQDLGHHMAIAAIVSDYASPGSLYPALYEPLNALQGNSLLYSLAAPLGRLVGVTLAVNLWLALAMAAVPIVVAVALRQGGRSVWPAVLAPALVHSLVFVAGFANLLFALPFIVLAVIAHEALVARPSTRHAGALAVTLSVLFLAHVHAFLWTGVLLATRTLGVTLTSVFSWFRAKSEDSFIGALRVPLASLASTLPALGLFARWYALTFGEGRSSGGVLMTTASSENGFGAWYRTFAESVRDLPTYVLDTTSDDSDLTFLVTVVGIIVVAALASTPARRVTVALPLAFVLTFASYFLLPEGLHGHDVVASRQPALAFLFLPALVRMPSPARAPWTQRLLVLALLGATTFHFVTWGRNLEAFERQEAKGLAEVLRDAPPRLRLHYVKSDPSSVGFRWRSFWHVEKFYMSSRLGQTPDTPAILSTGALRARAGVNLHRLVDHGPNWPFQSELWEAFDLVLLRRWSPMAEARAEVEKHATLWSKHGDWELWRTRTATDAR
jgi:hypothetical protein